MNVRELIQHLSQLDPEMRVVVAGYEGGFNDITELESCDLRLHVYQDWFYGAHERADNQSIQQLLPEAPVVPALVLKGKNDNVGGLTSGYLLGRGWRGSQ